MDSVTITTGTLTLDTYCEGTSTLTVDGKTITVPWTGTFDGIRKEHREMYAFFRGGHLNGTYQGVDGLHGFPVAALTPEAQD